MPKISFNAQAPTAPKAPALHEKVGMSLDDIAKLKREREQKSSPQACRFQQAGRGQPVSGRGQVHAGRGQPYAGRGQPHAGRSQPEQHAPQLQAKSNAHPAYIKFHKVQKSHLGPKQHQQGPPVYAKANTSNQPTTVVYKPIQPVPHAPKGGGRGKPGLPGSGRGGAAASGGKGFTGKSHNPRGYQQQQQQQQHLHPRGVFKPQQYDGRTRQRRGGTFSQKDLIKAAEDPDHPLHHTLAKIVEAQLSQRTGSGSRGRGAAAGEAEDLEAILGEAEEEEGEEEEEGSVGLESQGGPNSFLGSSWSGAAGEGEDEGMEEGAELPEELLDVDPSGPPMSNAALGFIASINAKRKKHGALPAPLPTPDVQPLNRQQQHHHHHHHHRDLSLYPLAHAAPLDGRGKAQHSSRPRRGADWDEDDDDAELAAYRHGMRLEDMRGGHHSRANYYNDRMDYDGRTGRNSRHLLPHSGYGEEEDCSRMRGGGGGSRYRRSTSPSDRAPYFFEHPAFEPGMAYSHARSRSRSPGGLARSISMHRYTGEGPPHKQQQQHDARARDRGREREREGDARHGARMDCERAVEPASAPAADGPDTSKGPGVLTSYLITERHHAFPTPGPPQQEVSSWSVARAAIAIEHMMSQQSGKRAVLPLSQLKRLKGNMEAGMLPVVVTGLQGRPEEVTLMREEVVTAMCDKDPNLDVIKRGIDLIDTNTEWSFAAGLVVQQLDNDEDMSQILLDIPDFTALPGEVQDELLAAWYRKEWPQKWPESCLKRLHQEEWSSEEEEEKRRL